MILPLLVLLPLPALGLASPKYNDHLFSLYEEPEDIGFKELVSATVVPVPIRFEDLGSPTIVPVPLAAVGELRPVQEGVPRYWHAADYPNPQLQPAECNVEHAGLLCDPNNVLTTVQEVQLVEDAIRRLRHRTSCGCDEDEDCTHGYSAAVAFVPNMVLQTEADKRNKSVVAQQFARQLLSKWNIGQCADDLLIFVSLNDKKMWTEAGMRTREVLSSQVIKEVTRANRHQFAEGRPASGVAAMLDAYTLRLQQAHDDEQDDWDDDDDDEVVPLDIQHVLLYLLITFLVLALGMCVFCVVCSYKKRRRSAFNMAGSGERPFEIGEQNQPLYVVKKTEQPVVVSIKDNDKD